MPLLHIPDLQSARYATHLRHTIHTPLRRVTYEQGLTVETPTACGKGSDPQNTLLTKRTW